MPPLVSICIPTFNGETHISECLDSVVSQSYENTEIIIVDDQSSDSTIDICQSYANQDNRIRIIKNKNNIGLVENWNKCISLSKGDWIKFVFQDDVIHPHCIEKMIDKSTLGVPFVLCKRNFIFENVSPQKRSIYEKYLTYLSLDTIFSGKEHLTPNDISKAVIDLGLYSLRNFIGEPTSTLLHRSIFRKYGLFNPHYMQICDYEYWLRVSLNTGITYIPENLASFRVHEKSTSSNNQKSSETRLDYLILLFEMAHNPLFKEIARLDKKSGKLLSERKLYKKSFNCYKKGKFLEKQKKYKEYLERWNYLNKHYHLDESIYFRIYNLLEIAKINYNKRIGWRIRRVLNQ